MNKAETLADIHNAMPETWWDDDQFAMEVTGGGMDAVIWE
jgi:hypothetical protein